MADMDWRVWVYNRLITSPLFTALVPEDRVHGGGSLTGIPEIKPFVVIRVGAENESVPGATITDLSLYFHDEPGSYNRLDDLWMRAKDALCGAGQRQAPVAEPGGICIKWQSTGGDLSDPGYGTLMKVSEYSLVGRNGNG